MKKIIGLIVVIFVLSGCNKYQANIKPYDNIIDIQATLPEVFSKDELISKSDYIIRGKVLTTISEENSYINNSEYDLEIDEEDGEQNYMPTYIADIEVEEVYKGKVDAKNIKILFSSALKDRTLFQVSKAVLPPTKDSTYVFFLNAVGNEEGLEYYEKSFGEKFPNLFDLKFLSSSMVNVDGKDEDNNSHLTLSKDDIKAIIEKYSK